LISSIARLGKVLRGKGSDTEYWVDRTVAKTVLVLKFRIGKAGTAKYVGIEIEQKKDEALYLYRRDVAGRGTGLFLTGRISRNDLRMLQKNLRQRDARNKEAKGFVEDFLRKKLDWLPKGAIVKDLPVLSTLGKSAKAVLESFLDAFKNSLPEIHADFIEKVRALEPEELLLTPKLILGSQERYVGEFPEYVTIFRSFVTGVREEDKVVKQASDFLACAVCNKRAARGKFSQPPLPFVTTDKPGFTPYGDQAQAYKVFPLCPDCYGDLRRGMKFIERHLDFSISSIKGKKAGLKFWLIPVLSNPSEIMPLLEDFGKSATEVGSTRFLYLKNLRTMCEAMEGVTAYASEGGSDIHEAYLTFTALFYTKDKQGWMRLISRSEGVYPSRLRFVAEIKSKVDSLYPFEERRVRFGFPLLKDFLSPPSPKKSKRKPEGWYRELASVLGIIFTGGPLNKELLYKAVARHIQQSARDGAGLGTIADLSLKGLSLIEYVEHLGPFEGRGGSP
jgi:hypothetical protein